MLAGLPELTFWRRVAFIIFLALTVKAIAALHSRYIPNAVISLASRKPGWAERAWPQVLSWSIAATSTLAAAVAYGVLSGQLPRVSAALSALFN